MLNEEISKAKNTLYNDSFLHRIYYTHIPQRQLLNCSQNGSASGKKKEQKQPHSSSGGFMVRGDQGLVKYCNLFDKIFFLQNSQRVEEMSAALQFQNEEVISNTYSFKYLDILLLIRLFMNYLLEWLFRKQVRRTSLKHL